MTTNSLGPWGWSFWPRSGFLGVAHLGLRVMLGSHLGWCLKQSLAEVDSINRPGYKVIYFFSVSRDKVILNVFITLYVGVKNNKRFTVQLMSLHCSGNWPIARVFRLFLESTLICICMVAYGDNGIGVQSPVVLIGLRKPLKNLLPHPFRWTGF